MRLAAGVLGFILAISTGGAALGDGIGDEDEPPFIRCAACHGLDGISHMSKFPKLAGQDAPYLIKQLQDFLHGRRNNDGGQMQTVVTELTGDELEEAASYFASLPKPPRTESSGESGADGAALFRKPDIAAGIPACIACHAGTSRTEGIGAPMLDGQHRAYIAKQLMNFKSGARANDAGGSMQAVARALGDTEIDALAAYLESSEPD